MKRSSAYGMDRSRSNPTRWLAATVGLAAAYAAYVRVSWYGYGEPTAPDDEEQIGCSKILRESPDREIADIPIVLLTAVAYARDVMRDIGAIDVIAKPVAFKRVLSAVERACSSAPVQ
jgi:hypothetical protein